MSGTHFRVHTYLSDQSEGNEEVQNYLVTHPSTPFILSFFFCFPLPHLPSFWLFFLPSARQVHCTGRKFDFPEPITELMGLLVQESRAIQWPISCKGSDFINSNYLNLRSNIEAFERFLLCAAFFSLATFPALRSTTLSLTIRKMFLFSFCCSARATLTQTKLDALQFLIIYSSAFLLLLCTNR